MLVDDHCTLDEYLQGDGNFQVSKSQSHENCDVNIMEELGQNEQDEDSNDKD